MYVPYLSALEMIKCYTNLRLLYIVYLQSVFYKAGFYWEPQNFILSDSSANDIENGLNI